MRLQDRLKNMTRSRLIKALDSEFRTFIRNRDITGTYTKCFVCGIMHESETLQVGHFVRRMETGLRWDEKNCHLICARCNGPESLNLVRYAKRLDKKYGEGTAEKLQVEGKFTKKFFNWEIEEKLKYYRDLNHERGKLISLLI